MRFSEKIKVIYDAYQVLGLNSTIDFKKFDQVVRMAVLNSYVIDFNNRQVGKKLIGEVGSLTYSYNVSDSFCIKELINNGEEVVVELSLKVFNELSLIFKEQLYELVKSVKIKEQEIPCDYDLVRFILLNILVDEGNYSGDGFLIDWWVKTNLLINGEMKNVDIHIGDIEGVSALGKRLETLTFVVYSGYLTKEEKVCLLGDLNYSLITDLEIKMD